MYVSVGVNSSYTPYETMLPIEGYGVIVCDCFVLVTGLWQL